MLAIAGGKGGSGKTTTTIGIGLAMVERGQRPILVDADVDVPDLHIRTSVDRDPGLPALCRVDAAERAMQRSTTYPGLDVIAAGTGKPHAADALERLRGLHRPVLVDCPAGAGPDAAAPLRVADRSVLVTLDTPESREDASKTAEMAAALDAPVAVTVRRAVNESAAQPATGKPLDETAASESAPVASPECTIPNGGSDPLASHQVRTQYAATLDHLDGRATGRTVTPGSQSTQSEHHGRNL